MAWLERDVLWRARELLGSLPANVVSSCQYPAGWQGGAGRVGRGCWGCWGCWDGGTEHRLPVHTFAGAQNATLGCFLQRHLCTYERQKH